MVNGIIIAGNSHQRLETSSPFVLLMEENGPGVFNSWEVDCVIKFVPNIPATRDPGRKSIVTTEIVPIDALSYIAYSVILAVL